MPFCWHFWRWRYDLSGWWRSLWHHGRWCSKCKAKSQNKSTGDFVLERTVDPDIGRTQLNVTLDGRDCVNITIAGGRAKSYVGFDLILQDLEDALGWIRAAHLLLPAKSKSDNQETVTNIYAELSKELGSKVKAYFYSAIITYGKCFASTTGRGTRLSAKDHVEPRFEPMHRKIINRRNGLVAHAGDEFDSAEVIVAIPPFGPRYYVAPILWRLDFDDFREFDPDFEDLIVHVKSKVDANIKILLQLLIDNEGREIVKAHRAKRRGLPPD